MLTELLGATIVVMMLVTTGAILSLLALVASLDVAITLSTLLVLALISARRRHLNGARFRHGRHGFFTGGSESNERDLRRDDRERRRKRRQWCDDNRNGRRERGIVVFLRHDVDNRACRSRIIRDHEGRRACRRAVGDFEGDVRGVLSADQDGRA